MTRSVRAGLVAAVLVVGAGACSSGSKTLDLGGGGSGNVVVMKDTPKPHFDPNKIKVPTGSEVTITLKNEGKRVHNFTVSFIGVDQDVQPGQTVQVKVKAPDRGRLTFYDKVDQGEGMQGQIEAS